jgi:hypothetical protein
MIRKVTLVALSFILIMLASERNPTATQESPLPNPVLVFKGVESFTRDGKTFMRYRYDVDNFKVYPDAMFAPAPALPPCGANTNAARTWVDFFDSRGKRLNGFCALGKANNLNSIWFALGEDDIPPSWVYIELTDRQTNTKYKSNLAETTL